MTLTSHHIRRHFASILDQAVLSPIEFKRRGVTYVIMVKQD